MRGGADAKNRAAMRRCWRTISILMIGSKEMMGIHERARRHSDGKGKKDEASC